MLTTTEKASVRHACPWNRANPVLTCVPMAGASVLCLLLLAGCTSQVKTEKAVTLEQPRVKNGVLIEEDDPVRLEELAAALDALDLPSADSDPAAEPNQPQKKSDPNQPAPVNQADASPPKDNAAKPAQRPQGNAKRAAPVDQANTSPPKIGVAEAMDMTAGQPVTPDSTKFIALSKLSRTEINEIVEHLVLGLESGLGYVAASPAIADALPIAPTGTLGDRILARSGETGTHVLRLGYRFFASQPPQLWVQGVIVGEDGALVANPDVAQIEPQVKQVIASLNEMRAALTVRDLDAKLIQLSYVDAATAMGMLKGFGITTFDQAAAVPLKIEFANLPYVVSIKDPEGKYTGLVGAKTKAEAAGTFKLSMAPGAAAELEDNTIASPLTQLLVLFHPAHPEQYSEVRRLLDTFIDRPARQIFIEAMVLEIGEQGLKELGVEWELNESPLFITAGSLNAGVSLDTLNIRTPDTSMLNEIFEGHYEWDWEVTIRALVRSGKAEILSRPSVLTLDNRQSTIRVGEDIPIASSVEGGYGGGKVGFKFEYLPTGILLNIRPRISESGAEVSMLVDTIVSARVPNEDFVIRDPVTLVELASAPTVSTRRVQTYGRIPNNTPLIIGGLVAREDMMTQDKVPILGDLPVIGIAFRSERKERLKREVIIVLTPHILPEQREVLRALPKDEDTFDNFGHELFRDSYRIRAEDVFDLTFLLENKRITTYRGLAREVAQKDFRLGAAEPFRSFVRDNVPGESILVTRMIYEVIKRLDIARQIETSRIIYFEGQQVGGYSVKFLEGILEGRAETGVVNFGDQALAITYQYDRASLEEGRLGSEPIPEIRLLSCPDRETWGKILWELNQPTADGHRRHTILIQDESDILRLRRALTLKRVAVLNGGLEEMRLRNFSVGKVLLMPELKVGQIHVVDADTAMFFFHTEHYYAATLAEIEKQLKELDRDLRRPDIRTLLDSPLPGDSPVNGGK